MNVLTKLANLGSGDALGAQSFRQEAICEACWILQRVLHPDFDEGDTAKLNAYLDCHAFLQAAEFLVPRSWSIFLARHADGRTEAVLRISPAREVVSSQSDDAGIALLSAVASMVLSSDNANLH